MNDKLPEPQNGQQGPNAQDPSRRRILRAAASAAPLIATLPSGAALATASAYQCAVHAQGMSTNLPAGDGGEYTTDTDTWIRYQVDRVIWWDGITPPASPEPTYRFPSGKVYTATGLEYQVPSDQDNNPYVPYGEPEPVRVLALYNPIYEGQNLIGLRNAACSQNIKESGIPEGECVWPFARIARNQSPGDTGNMGIYGTCMCSFNPGHPVC